MRAGLQTPFSSRCLHEGGVLGEELVLHFARDRQLRLEPLLLLGHHDQLAQILGHGVERGGQFGKLVVALDRNAVGEVALFDVLRAEVQLVHGAGDAAAETDARDQRRQLHQEEQDGDADEEPERHLSPVHLLAELVEDDPEDRGEARIHQQEQAVFPAGASQWGTRMGRTPLSSKSSAFMGAGTCECECGPGWE